MGGGQVDNFSNLQWQILGELTTLLFKAAIRSTYCFLVLLTA